jgi:hypothetical protein
MIQSCSRRSGMTTLKLPLMKRCGLGRQRGWPYGALAAWRSKVLIVRQAALLQLAACKQMLGRQKAEDSATGEPGAFERPRGVRKI